MRMPALLALLLVGRGVAAQELVLEKRIEGRFDAITTDNLGQLYTVKGFEVTLHTSGVSGQLTYRYSDMSQGRIGMVDTRNPMKVLVFYPDFSSVVWLDNTLSRSRDRALSLTSLQLDLAQLVCTSFDNGIWVYDPVSFRLLRFDQHMQVTNRIDQVNQLVGADIEPTVMTEEGDWLYLSDPRHGIFRFDVFGTYSRTIPVKGVKDLQVRDNGLFMLRDEGLFRYDPLTHDLDQIDLPVPDARAVRIEKKRLYLLMKDGVLIYGPGK